MELFHDPKIDWLGKKWYFLGFSLIFSVAGVLSMLFWHHLPLDVDFRGGTVVRVKFAAHPDADRIRAAIDKSGLKDARIQQPYGPSRITKCSITLAHSETSESALDQGRATIVSALTQNYAGDAAQNQGKLDLDNVSGTALTSWLEQNDPEHLGNSPEAETRYQTTGQRDSRPIATISTAALSNPSNACMASSIPPFLTHCSKTRVSPVSTSQGGEIVGAQVGARSASRPSWPPSTRWPECWSICGSALSLFTVWPPSSPVFHDTLITVGAFCLANREISLTVIAAILTLIGYSMNDTIVVFDRIRENLRLSRREPLADLVNRSINQTLSRTVLTSGLTFLTVLSLYLFGGEVLRGFSFALVVGILIGTYSSIAVAAPMLVAYQDWRAGRGRPASLPAAKKARV